MKHLLFLLLTLNICKQVVAQVPQALNYQAVARKSDGNILTNQSVRIRFSILDGSSAGPIVYQETHQSTTNNFGLFTLSIGKGSSTINQFVNINWAKGDKFLKVEIAIQGGSSYELQGVTQLLSVPYALYAESSGSSGIAGPPGPIGPQGIQGPAGTAGINGKTVLNGTIPPSFTVGTDGDFYLNTTSNQIYGPKNGGNWGNGTNLTGPIGPAGAIGQKGNDGRSMLHGNNPPSSSIGNDGDFYINTISNQLFGPKSGGTWGSGISIIGPQGAQGASGTNGINGKSLLNGTTNPSGTVGLDGDFYINTSTNQMFGPKTGGNWNNGVNLVGPIGQQGPNGPVGPTGTAGPAGASGKDGRSILSGSSVPGTSIGNDGDFYINTTSNHLFGPKTAGVWGTGTNLIGPQGPVGANGINGNSILNGTINPSTAVGKDGDFYINSSTNMLFGPKTAGNWNNSINLIGPIGPQGPEGLKSLIDMKNFSANASCPTGGILITSGIDINNNLVLDAIEIDNSKMICFTLNSNPQDKLIILPINFGGNTTSSTPTKGIGLVKFNKNNYPGVDSIILVCNPFVGNVGNTAIVQLINMTDNVVLNNSTVTTNNLYSLDESAYLSSGNVFNALPNYDISLGINFRSGNENMFAATGTCYLYLYRK